MIFKEKTGNRIFLSICYCVTTAGMVYMTGRRWHNPRVCTLGGRIRGSRRCWEGIAMPWSKETRQSRGYGARWEKTRLRILERDKYLCQCRHCRNDKVHRPATEVDHVVSKANARRMGWSEERIEADSNLQAINADCHKRKNVEDLGKDFKARRKIGLDGFPIEG